MAVSSKSMLNRRWIWITTAAAVLQQQQHQLAVSAFVVQPRSFQTTRSSWIVEAPSASRSYGSTTQLQMGVLDTIKGAAKAILPKSWTQSKEQRKAELARKEVEKEIKGSIQQVLKDAPLPIRMLGSAIAPLFSSAMSSLAQAAEEQQATMATVLTQASSCIINDSAVLKAYGSDVQMSMQPFSQSSSTSSINGQSTTRIQVGVEVFGSLDSGVATISANEKGIQSIALQSQTSGRTINVSTSNNKKGGAGRRIMDGDDDNNIIEAEIIEKKVQK